ncbi:Ras- protein Rab-24 [Desmophyllum pertusum]|uniref:Ras- protein Rab-24 n=1 Tax=Desmophyllum pertusum TaxID=174260 RepID=A0A9W9Z7N0_9CNID|nr:Ras- protein Rab-24 [Desmophyllum pertusum]
MRHSWNMGHCGFQSVFESMSALYYRGAIAAIVCYDITDYSSFEKAKFYVNEIREKNENCWLYLCGTKYDLISSGEQFRDVTNSHAVDYAQKIKSQCSDRDVQVKLDRTWDELFQKIAKDILGQKSTDNTEPAHKLGFHDPSQTLKAPCGCKG